MATTTKGYPYPLSSDANDIAADLQLAAEANDERPGVSPLTTAARDALAGAELWSGRVIFNTTTERVERYTGAAWVPASDEFLPFLLMGAI